MKSVYDDPEVKAANARLNGIVAKLTEVKGQLSEPQPPSDPVGKAKDAILAGQTPSWDDLETRSPSQSKLYNHLVALGHAKEEQKRNLQKAIAAAKGRLIGDEELSQGHIQLLIKVGAAAKSFGEVATQLEKFYEQLETAGVGGSTLGHFGWGIRNPGLLSDPNSDISTWVNEVRKQGYWFHV